MASPRCVAFADIEGDGDLDFAITDNGGTGHLFRPGARPLERRRRAALE